MSTVQNRQPSQNPSDDLLHELDKIIKDVEVNNPLHDCLNGFRHKFMEISLSDRVHQLITSNTPDIVGHLNINGIITHVNPAIETLLGIKTKEIIGQSALDLFDRIHPDDKALILQRFNERHELDINKTEMRFRHTSGHYIWIEALANLLKNPQGEPEGVVFTLRDLSDRKQSEDDIKRQTNYLNSIINANPSVIEVKDADGRFILVNEASAKSNGLSIEAVIGKTNQEIATNSEDAESFLETDKRVIETLEPIFIPEESITYFDGSIHWHQTIKLPLIQDEGEPQVLVISTDITDRKKIEEALIASETHYRELFEGINDAIIIHDLDGNYIDVNESACRRYGYTYDEFTTMSYKDLDLPEFASGFKERLAIQIKDGFFDNMQGTHITKDGRHIPIDINSKRIDYNGQPAILTVVRDISPLKKVETELRDSERKNRDILSAIPDMIMRITREGVVLDLQPATDFESLIPKEEYIGRNIQTTLPNDIAEEALRHYSSVLDTGEIVIYEYNLPDKNGVRHYEARVVPYADNEILAIIRDVTARKEREAFIIEQEQVRLLKSFIGNTYHDLQTPITTFKTSLYLLGRTHEQLTGHGVAIQATQSGESEVYDIASNIINLTESAQRRIETITKNVNRLQQLLDSMIKLARLESNTNYTFTRFDINYLLDTCREQLYDKAQKKSTTVTLEPADKKLLTLADSVELQTAVSNIAENALDFSPEQSTITIKTYRQEDKVVVSISDQGAGITQTDLPLIFNRFYRADNARGMDTGGAGIGLTIAKTIIEAHMGTIEVESTPNEGSEFRIILPALDVET